MHRAEDAVLIESNNKFLSDYISMEFGIYKLEFSL